MTLLSIIIPAYNAEPYIFELLDILTKQLTKEVDIIVIDDGSKKPLDMSKYPVNLIRQENKGASAARNTGIDFATGKYIAFIDADDIVSNDYVTRILDKIKTEKPDYIYLSWKAFGGWNCNVKLNSLEDQFPPFNCCVWNRVYKRSMIGDVRFNVLKACAEDAQFIRDVGEKGKKAIITDYVYFYRSNAADSLTKRARAGKVDTKRIVYHFPHVTADMSYLLEEFKELDKDTEVILLTNKNDIPELTNYAMVLCPPQNVSAPELRGEPTPYFHQIQKPLKTQVLIYVTVLRAIGGIETWTYNFCQQMHKFYDITVLCDKEPDEKQKRRLLSIADVVVNSSIPIVCDTAINCRVAMPLPKNVQYKHKYQVVHTCKLKENWNLVESAERTFYVSEASRKSYNDNTGEVLYNMTYPQPIYRKPLLLVSATRLSWEKGGSRIHRLARMLKSRGFLFTWLVFTDQEPQETIDGLVYRKPTFNIREYIQQADIYISLSDQESFGYSIVEALELGTPVLTTPIDVLPEIGFEEGVNGFTIPYNVEQCKNLEEIFTSNLKGFWYHWDNDTIVEQWRDILGRDTTPTRNISIKPGYCKVMALQSYYDTPLKRDVKAFELLEVPDKIAKEGAKQGFYEILS